MTFTLVIVTCFAMSFALRSAPIARLVLDASLLHCTQAAIPTLFVLCFAIRIVCRLRFPLCLLLCTVFLLNAGPSLPTWHCISLSAGFASVWWSFLALFLLVLQTRLALNSLAAYPCCVEPFILSFTFSSLKLVCSRSATLNLATALLSARSRHHCTWRLLCLSARGRASACSGPCCEPSSGSSVPILALVELRQFSAQP